MSDLQPDPALRFGTLDNGLRYVIMHNDEPEDRVGLYLNIQSGSLEEKDTELGYAHFLEHMLFNGTTNYPPGTLVEYFQSIGMAFGSDTNAHTTYDETVYRLLLPYGSEKNLREGLLVMADYARGALLLESEVERERGIILAEKRARDSAGYRLYEKRMRFSFEGTRIAERFPIGTVETLQKADAAGLRAFYDSWYRPENMILVIVGDAETGLVERLVRERFASLASPPMVPECFDFGKVDETGHYFLYEHEPEIGATQLSISTNWNTSPESDSIAKQQKDMKDYIAVSLLQNRLMQLVREPDSPLTKAYTYAGDHFQRFGYATVSATVEGHNWQQGLDLLEKTVRQAVDHGFSERELLRVKKEIMASLEKDVQTVSSRDSRKLASTLIDTLNRDEVFLSPSQKLELYGPVVEFISLAEVNALFRELWSRKNRRVIVAGTAEISGELSPEETIRQVYDRGSAKKLPFWQERNIAEFPYLALSENASVITDLKHFAEIDVDRYSFANGTVLNIKETSFQPNEVLVEVHFGPGKLSETAPGLSMLAESIVNESGVGRLTRNDLEDVLAGKNIDVSFKIDGESFVLKGSGLSEELVLIFELIRTRLLDPAFREDAYKLSMERFGQMYEQMLSSIDGMMQLQGERFLAGGNPRYGMPPLEEFKKLSLDQVQSWLIPFFKGASLEISVVGDIKSAKVAELASRYFGMLERNHTTDLPQKAIVFPSGEKFKESVPTQVDKSLVTVAWPTDDFWDISRTRRLNIMSAVFADRLRLEIREKLGAVYSPHVYNHSSRSDPGYGVLRAMLTVDPAQSEEVADKVREVGEIMYREGVTEEELTRSLEPVLTSIKDMMQKNGYWMGSVLSLSSRHPGQLEWPKTIQSDFASIHAEEISEYASRYLNPDVSAEIIFQPKEH